MAIKRTLDEVRALLDADGILVDEARAIPHGTQLRCQGGSVIVNVYATGSVVPQGRGAEGVRAMLDAAPPRDAAADRAPGFATTPAMCEAALAAFPADGWVPAPRPAGWPSAPGTAPF